MTAVRPREWVAALDCPDYSKTPTVPLPTRRTWFPNGCGARGRNGFTCRRVTGHTGRHHDRLINPAFGAGPGAVMAVWS